MNNEENRVVINGVTYIREDSGNTIQQTEILDGMPYVIIRSRDAGVHVGYLKKQETNGYIELLKTRRIWSWTGNRFTLSDIATNGVDTAKLSIELPKITIFNACEIIECSVKSAKCLMEFDSYEI